MCVFWNSMKCNGKLDKLLFESGLMQFRRLWDPQPGFSAVDPLKDTDMS